LLKVAESVYALVRGNIVATYTPKQAYGTPKPKICDFLTLKKTAISGWNRIIYAIAEARL
jgi:hypothetical protein